MSDANKTTPRPWRHGNAYGDPERGEDIFIGADGTVVATTGDIGGFLKEGDAELVLVAVNSYNPERDKLARELAALVNVLKGHLEATGEYAICRSDREKMGLADQMTIGQVLTDLETKTCEVEAALKE